MAQEKDSKSFHFKTLLLKYFRILILSLGVPLTVVICIIIALLLSNANNKFRQENDKMLDKAAVYMDGVWAHTQSSALKAAYDQAITKFFFIDRSRLSIEMLSGIGKVQAYLRAMSSDSTLSYVIVNAFDPAYYIRNGSAWSRPDNIWYTSEQRHPYSLLKSFENSDEDVAWQLSGNDMCYLQSILVRNQRVGCILLRCDSLTLSGTITGTIQDGTRRSFMIDESGTILQDSTMRSIGVPIGEVYPDIPAGYDGQFTYDGVSYAVLATFSEIPGWRYVLVSDQTAPNRYAALVLAVGLLTVVIILSLCVRIAYRLAQTICQPYETILDLLRTPVKDARENYEHRYAAYDELGMIYTLINQTRYQNFTMHSELTEREHALRDAQRTALQAQMNPHFMFNTLEAINWRVFEKLPNDREITGMIQDLSLLLRLSLETDSPLISLQEEIHHAKVYLKIQRNRLDSDFEVQWDIAPEMMQKTALHLSLQPLFENAISHGIKKLDSGGVIRVEGRVCGDRMLLSVIDNGPGFDEVALQRIRRSLVDSRWKRSNSIGLVNVNTRIQLLFGMDYGIQIESVPYMRTEVRIVTPADGEIVRKEGE